jgi:hypothetical protein
MEDEQFEDLENLEFLFSRAQEACNPIDFSLRQRDLLYFITLYLLSPYYQEMKRMNKEEKERKDKDKRST